MFLPREEDSGFRGCCSCWADLLWGYQWFPALRTRIFFTLPWEQFFNEVQKPALVIANNGSILRSGSFPKAEGGTAEVLVMRPVKKLEDHLDSVEATVHAEPVSCRRCEFRHGIPGFFLTVGTGFDCRRLQGIAANRAGSTISAGGTFGVRLFFELRE